MALKQHSIVTALLFLSPLSLSMIWVFVPGGMTGGFAGYEFFIESVSRYPNWGSVNLEVVLGLVCIVMSAFLPTVFALSFLFKCAYRQQFLAAILLLYLVIYIPVFMKLDFLLWFFAFNKLYVLPNAGVYQGIDVAYAPMMHLFFLLLMSFLFFKSIKLQNN